MRKDRWILLPLVVLGFLILFLPACEKGAVPELTAAQEAIDAAKAEGAPDLCPEEYSNAELKLKQAQLLYEDNEADSGKEAAEEAETLGKEALDCALLAKQPSEVQMSSLPEELVNYKTSVFFDFNDNGLRPEESAKLGKAAAKIAKYQKDIHFWVLVETHADLPGTPEDNRLLTERRAKVVRYFLVQNGVDPDRIILWPRGEYLANKELVIEGKGKKVAKKKNKDYRRADISVVEEMPELKKSLTGYYQL